MQAIASRSCPSLACLEIGGNDKLGDEVMAEIIGALACRDTCPCLRHLGITSKGLGEASGRALITAIQSNVWPELRRLEIHRNPGMGDETKGLLTGALAARRIAW